MQTEHKKHINGAIYLLSIVSISAIIWFIIRYASKNKRRKYLYRLPNKNIRKESECTTDPFLEHLETLYICIPGSRPQPTTYFTYVDANGLLWKACIQKHYYNNIKYIYNIPIDNGILHPENIINYRYYLPNIIFPPALAAKATIINDKFYVTGEKCSILNDDKPCFQNYITLSSNKNSNRFIYRLYLKKICSCKEAEFDILYIEENDKSINNVLCFEFVARGSGDIPITLNASVELLSQKFYFVNLGNNQESSTTMIEYRYKNRFAKAVIYKSPAKYVFIGSGEDGCPETCERNYITLRKSEQSMETFKLYLYNPL